MNIVIIAAMPEEFRAVARCLEPGIDTKHAGIKTLSSRASGHDVLLLQSGMGFDNAAMAVESAIGKKRPDLLISVGLCGGISPELQSGDLVVAKQIVIVTTDGYEDVPVTFSASGQTFVVRQAGKRVFNGLFASTPVIMSKARLAGMLPTECPCRVVEMESAAIAIVATEHNIPFLALRAVSDDASEELDFSLGEFCDSDMRRIRFHKVLLTILRKPGIIPQLVRLLFSSRRAAQNLTGALSCLFSTL